MKKVIILLGPTGVGKTGVSLLLAKELDTEIISADSMQIYRYMDIGTAKPSQAERKTVKHHMIDVVDPWDSFNVGKYISAVVPIVEKLHREGRIPVVVGGTGLYIKAMTRGIFDGPSADWILRKRLLAMEEEEEGSLHAYLKELDPLAAGKITPNDTRRITRALEVCLKSSMSMSEMQEKRTKPLAYEFVKIGITRDRKELYRLIESRVDMMIESGLVDETRELLTTNLDKTPLQAIGYKEIAMYINGAISLDEAIGLIKRNTKRYAKRQFTWFRKEAEIHWTDLTGVYDRTQAFDLVNSVLKTLG
jgi:tRNA dimethylallyltransferase